MAKDTPKGSNRFTESPWNEINSPGSYVNRADGNLYRVPSTALLEGHSPVVNIVGPDGGSPTMVRISSDPHTPIGKCRELASNADIQPNF